MDDVRATAIKALDLLAVLAEQLEEKDARIAELETAAREVTDAAHRRFCDIPDELVFAIDRLWKELEKSE